MSILKPINIIFRDDKGDDFTQYIYELTLTMKDNTNKKFKEICNMKYCKLFTFNEMIPFDMIKNYNLDITLIKFTKDIYNINNIFTIDEDTHIYKNDEIYIEFIQNNDRITSCCCSLKVLDNTRLFITPPNY